MMIPNSVISWDQYRGEWFVWYSTAMVLSREHKVLYIPLKYRENDEENFRPVYIKRIEVQRDRHNNI